MEYEVEGRIGRNIRWALSELKVGSRTTVTFEDGTKIVLERVE
jgi:hypothetical protein